MHDPSLLWLLAVAAQVVFFLCLETMCNNIVARVEKHEMYMISILYDFIIEKVSKPQYSHCCQYESCASVVPLSY